MSEQDKRYFEDFNDAELVFHFKGALLDENLAKEYRQRVEEEVTRRLIAKEEAGEKARIQLASGEDVSLGDEQPYFKYTDVDAPAVHEWVKSVGLGNLIKEPKIHNASLNSNLRQLVKEGVDIPDFMQIESRRQLTKRGMK
jgi:hypothetical protein